MEAFHCKESFLGLLVGFPRSARTRDICPGLAALIGQVQNIIFLTVLYLSASLSKLDRQSYRAAFLFICVSGLTSAPCIACRPMATGQFSF
jgi:hypothetical protein